MSCISACQTQDHKTWGECRRAHGMRVGYARSATNPRNDKTADKRWQAELDLYARARREGIQPDSTKTKDIRRAMEISDSTGMAYGA